MALTATHAVRDRENEQAYPRGCAFVSVKVSMHIWNHKINQGVMLERRSGRERPSIWETIFYGEILVCLFKKTVAFLILCE